MSAKPQPAKQTNVDNRRSRPTREDTKGADVLAKMAKEYTVERCDEILQEAGGEAVGRLLGIALGSRVDGRRGRRGGRMKKRVVDLKADRI